tara:strand:- start:2012 stop:2383 length:372 start_codon:yes stop_codon:yes gene_type:complete
MAANKRYLTKFLSMDSNMVREFVDMMKNTNKMDDETYFAYLDLMDNHPASWYIFEEIRPVTAHLLKELFGERAFEYVSHLERNFTEEKAVEMVKYVEKAPQNTNKMGKMNRIKLALQSMMEEE